MIGFLLAFLAVPALLSWVAQIRFARRFERLVKQGRVLPVFIRDQGLNEGQDMITVANGAGDVYSIPIKNGRRTKVSMKSFLEAWVDVRYHFNDAKYWKVSSPSSGFMAPIFTFIPLPIIGLFFNWSRHFNIYLTSHAALASLWSILRLGVRIICSWRDSPSPLYI
jgi:hypothetical protein